MAGHILTHGERLEQCAELEIHAEAQPEFVEFLVRHLGCFPSEDLDRAAGRLERANDMAKQCALAAARASHNDHRVAFVNAETNAVEHGPVSKLAHEVADFDDGIFLHVSQAAVFPGNRLSCLLRAIERVGHGKDTIRFVHDVLPRQRIGDDRATRLIFRPPRA